MKLTQLIKYNLFTKQLSELPTTGKYVINTINPHSYCVAKKDVIFSNALKTSDVLLPDGIGIVLATKILTGKSIEKIAGADVHHYLLKQANKKKQKVCYLGASEKTLQLIKERIHKEYKNIRVTSYSPPFKEEFSKQDNLEMLKFINTFKPNILFVGLTAPKQEKWVYINKEAINANTIVSIGAVFDFYAGTVVRSSKFWIQIGLEWLPRLLREPKRLWKRNFISTPEFILDVLKVKINEVNKNY